MLQNIIICATKSNQDSCRAQGDGDTALETSGSGGLGETVMPIKDGSSCGLVFDPVRGGIACSRRVIFQTPASVLNAMALVRTETGEANWKRSRGTTGAELVPALQEHLIHVQHINRKSGLFGPTMLLSGHKGEVFCGEFSPDGCALATGSYDKTISLWQVYGDGLTVAPWNHRINGSP